MSIIDYFAMKIVPKIYTTDARGQQSGGPQYYLQRAIGGAGGRALSVFFACAAVLASFGIGSMTQSNAVAAQLQMFMRTSASD